MIQVLSQETINQIAAGEVIERPAAVVKELVENSIDAGATAITVEIKDGGLSFIRITDNGCGIAGDEIKTAFLRHATSKIQTKEDLLTVTSLGFRGEALSSIAAVAQVELVTKRAGDITGARYEIAGGKENGLQEIGCPDGTTFVVRNLFYNTPARRKFLKTKVTEGSYVQDLVLRYSLAHADIRFHFIVDGKSRLQTSGDGNLKTNIYYNYGPDVTRCMVEIQESAYGLKLSGFVGKPELSRGNRTFMNYFVNGRYIKSKIITSAIEHAYKKYLMAHRYPFTALMLSIDSDCLDVNVHPAKMEVRFTNQEDVYHLFYEAISKALQSISLIPEVSLKDSAEKKKTEFPISAAKSVPEPFEHVRTQEENKEKKRGITEKDGQEHTKTLSPFSQSAAARVSEPGNYRYEQKNLDVGEMIEKGQDKPHFRIIGQVFATYWLIEYGDSFLVIDQHAAHEKVLYEKLMKQISQKEGLTQGLAVPVVITLTEREAVILQENIESFEKLGFRLEHFGEKDYLLTGVPADFLNVASKDLFLDMLDNLSSGGRQKEPERVLERCASMACKAAIKGNQMMSVPEAERLIEQMLAMEQPYHCPHGRPTTIAVSRQEFEKKFKRII